MKCPILKHQAREASPAGLSNGEERLASKSEEKEGARDNTKGERKRDFLMSKFCRGRNKFGRKKNRARARCGLGEKNMGRERQAIRHLVPVSSRKRSTITVGGRKYG